MHIPSVNDQEFVKTHCFVFGHKLKPGSMGVALFTRVGVALMIRVGINLVSNLLGGFFG